MTRAVGVRDELARLALDSPVARAVGVPTFAKGVERLLPGRPREWSVSCAGVRIEVATEPRAKDFIRRLHEKSVVEGDRPCCSGVVGRPGTRPAPPAGAALSPR